MRYSIFELIWNGKEPSISVLFLLNQIVSINLHNPSLWQNRGKSPHVLWSINYLVKKNLITSERKRTYIYILPIYIRSSVDTNRVSSQDFPSICIYVFVHYYYISFYRTTKSFDDSSKFYVILQVTYDRLLQREQTESH